MANATAFLAFVLSLIACVRPPSNTLRPGNHDLSLSVNGLARTYILRVPPAARRGQPLPLLIVLHGGGGSGQKMQRFLGFDAYADERGFYAAYPDSYRSSGRRAAHWNDGRGTEATSGVDDVKFLLEMIADIGRRVPLDKHRVYVTGASNGGMMAYRLGCETAGVLAGIAPMIANIPQPIFEVCAPAAPLNFLAVNGSADPLIPLEGGAVCEDIRFGCAGGLVVSQAKSVGAFCRCQWLQPRPAIGHAAAQSGRWHVCRTADLRQLRGRRAGDGLHRP